MGKRVSVYELKEGKTYAAFNGRRKLKRTFHKKNGKLYTDAGEASEAYTGYYSGCQWVPPSADYSFEEIKEPKKVIVREDSADHQHEFSVIHMKEDRIYQWENGYLSGDNLVMRKGGTLYFCDKWGKRGAKVRDEQISLRDVFKPYEPTRPEPVKEEPKPNLFERLEQRARSIIPANAERVRDKELV